MTHVTSRKVMILGGRLTLKEFQVRGWKKGPVVETKHKTHFSSGLLVKEVIVTRKRQTWEPIGRVEIVKAVSGLEASKAYARRHQIKNDAWLDLKPGTEVVVIRVSNLGEKAP